MIKDISTAKEELQALAEINADTVKAMTEEKLTAFVDALDAAASAFPAEKKELTAALGQKDYPEVFKLLAMIVGWLTEVHAENLARECEKQIESNKDISKVRHEKVKAFIDYLVPSLEMFFEDVHVIISKLKVEDVEPQTKKRKVQKRTITPEIVREKLLTVNELNHEIINEMSDEELCAYLTVLDLYHIDCQSQKAGLSGALKIKHYVFVLQWLNTIEETLTKIHATELAAGCRDQIAANKEFNNIRHSRLTVYVNYLISTMSMLSSDIISLGLPKKLTVPREKSSEAANVEFEILTAGTSEDSKKILIVNKMKMFMNSLKNALSYGEFTIIGINSAESVVGYLQNEKPDLFILDEDLQGTDGLLLIKVIRASGQMAPIIFTTSKITKAKMVKFMEAGVADFIMKPISPSDVQKKVSKHLS